MKALVFEIDAGLAERFADSLIASGALCVTTEDALAGTPQETPLFDEPGEIGSWTRLRMSVLCDDHTNEATLLQRAGEAAGSVVSVAVAVEHFADEDWVCKTQSQFFPIRASARIWVVPSWHEAPDPGAINIVLDPGLAFGTGSHPTTRLCLKWLDESIVGGEAVLDYGCGSGILAIAAMKLGAARATGVDVDPQALAAAVENAVQNDVACSFLEAGAPIVEMCDIVIANILTNPLKNLAPMLAARTRPGGRIAMTGILETQAGEVQHAYRRWFEFDTAIPDDGWVLITGRRGDSSC